MGRFIVTLAERSDENGLRRILRDNCMGGGIRLSFQREPDFFRSLQIDGRFTQVVVGRDLKKKKIIGFGIRSVRKLFVNGSPKDIGYLSNLRLDNEYRGRTLLGRGYRFFRELHRDGKTMIYITSIVEDNLNAFKILTSGKGGLPPYKDFGRYITYAVGVKRRKCFYKGSMEIKRCNSGMLEDVVSFLQMEGSKKQFYPFYTEEDLKRKDGLLRGLKVEDLIVVIKSGRIVGVIGLWDQSNFKQNVVCGYSLLTKIIRIPWNALSPIIDIPSLPSVGSRLKFFFAALNIVENNDRMIFHNLLEKLREEGAERGYEYLVVGLHSRDTLNIVMKCYPGFRLKTRIFIVHWDDGLETYQSLDSRIPYIEVGTL